MLRLDGVIFTLINLLVLYAAMKHFLFGPIQNVLNQRKEIVQNQLTDAQHSKEEAEKTKQEYEGLLLHAKEESMQMMETARVNAQKEYDSKLEEASLQADHILEKAQKDIVLEQEKAMGDMQSRIAQVAMAAAGKILMENADSTKNQLIYDEYIKRAGEGYEADCH